MTDRVGALLELIAAVNQQRRDVSLDAMARMSHRSPYDLHRRLRQLLNETPKAYLTRVRLARAAAELVATGDLISDIARRHGFDNPEVFSRTFRTRFAATPTQYRARGLHVNDDRDAGIHLAVATATAPCLGLYHITTSEGNEPVHTEIVVKELPSMHALIMRARVPRGEIAAALGKMLPSVYEAVQQHGLALAGPPFTRYPEIGMGMVVMEGGFAIAAPPGDGIELGEGIEVLSIPGGPAAITVHHGQYDTLPTTYAAIEQWTQDAGRAPAGPPRETYLTDPGEFPDPATWETEVVQPII